MQFHQILLFLLFLINILRYSILIAFTIQRYSDCLAHVLLAYAVIRLAMGLYTYNFEFLFILFFRSTVVFMAQVVLFRSRCSFWYVNINFPSLIFIMKRYSNILFPWSRFFKTDCLYWIFRFSILPFYGI